LSRSWIVSLAVLASMPAVALLAPGAAAHAVLESSSPRDGSVLQEAPASVTVTVTERPDPKLSAISVIDRNGRDNAEGDLVVNEDGSELSTNVRDLPKGVYTVSWRVFSTVDGHITGGVFAFGVQVPPDAVAPQTLDQPAPSGPTPGEVTGRTLFYVGVIVLIGAAWVAAFAFTTEPRALRWLLRGGVAAGMLGAALLGLAQSQKSGANLGSFLSTSIGRAVVFRGLALTLAIPAVALHNSRSTRLRRVVLTLAVLAGGAAILANTSAGHAAAPPTAWAKISVQTLHMTAVAVWMGGLAALIVGLRSSDSGTAAVARFSKVAGVAVFLVLGAGTFRAVNEVSRWSELVSTGYGRIVLAKLALFAVIGVVATINRYRNVPTFETTRTPLIRFSTIELGLGMAVLVLTGLLTSLVPARVAARDATTISVTAVGQDFAGTVRAQLEVTPGVPGANRFVATLQDPATDDAVDAQGVSLRLIPPATEDAESSTLELKKDNGRWLGQGNGLFVAGVWKATVLVRSGTDSVEVQLVVPTRCDTQATPVNGQPTLYDVDTGVGTAQGYIDPGEPGKNELHFTYFDASGTELDLADSFAVTALRLDGERTDPTSLRARRLSSGHFVASAQLQPGRWRFDAASSTEDGERARACFEEEIG
jgi:copper transport protein